MEKRPPATKVQRLPRELVREVVQSVKLRNWSQWMSEDRIRAFAVLNSYSEERLLKKKIIMAEQYKQFVFLLCDTLKNQPNKDATTIKVFNILRQDLPLSKLILIYHLRKHELMVPTGGLSIAMHKECHQFTTQMISQIDQDPETLKGFNADFCQMITTRPINSLLYSNEILELLEKFYNMNMAKNDPSKSRGRIAFELFTRSNQTEMIEYFAVLCTRPGLSREMRKAVVFTLEGGVRECGIYYQLPDHLRSFANSFGNLEVLLNAFEEAPFARDAFSPTNSIVADVEMRNICSRMSDSGMSGIEEGGHGPSR